MGRIGWRRGIVPALVLSLLIGILSGCAAAEEQKEDLTATGFAFDTTYNITLYEGGTGDILNSCVQLCSRYERVFSRTLEDSELYQVNELESLYGKAVEENKELGECLEKSPALSDGKKSRKQQGASIFTEKQVEGIVSRLNSEKSEKNQLVFRISEEGRMEITVSDLLKDLVGKGLEYSEATRGRFDITVEPLTSLWNFKAEKPVVPDRKSIEGAVSLIDYRNVVLEGNTLSFLRPGMGIDLGGIAKGFIADGLKSYLSDQGVTGALINLGGNVLCLGGKDGGKNFSIGVQQPFADRNEVVVVLGVQDLSVVSSGIYERYIETEDGTFYHHILDPKTGYSYDNDLLGVTILSERSVDGDGLSTSCFSMGREEGIRYINSLEGVYAMFITKDEKLWYSDGFEEFLETAQK